MVIIGGVDGMAESIFSTFAIDGFFTIDIMH
jgi:hypothetical protein